MNLMETFQHWGKQLGGTFSPGGTDPGTVETGTMETLSPLQQQLLNQQITQFMGQAPVTPQAGAAPRIGLDQEAFMTGTVDPIMQQVQQRMTDIGNQMAGGRFGSERQKAGERVMETGQQAISQELAKQSLATQQANQAAILQQRGIDVQANQAAQQQRNALLQALLGTQTLENYAIARGGETRGAGLGYSALTGLMGGVGRGIGAMFGG